ncbi:arylsulfatase [Parasphingopyxis algicola]|uniref:arylsulfatase n=1 Tax=Parasphingopyxis algicola TaxID=2026624 RepID=UPI0015A04C3D|nr:arylsulfatase [Parasphingopyxis algicola]QLC24934.1 arylsulfatase [Parasphingopyxis algicola]
MSGILGAVLFLFGVPGAAAQEQHSLQPNFVVILVDDAALMDFGAYGGEARTPNIDALARRGAIFTQYRTSPLCAPSRAMLLTGIDNHRTGVATIPEVLPAEHAGMPGYSMALEPGVLTLADRLRQAGYRTYMTGKWHLGSGAEDLPNSHGFERSFALDASGADNWEQRSYMPFYDEAPWYEDGVPATLPEDFYSSRFIVDRMIDYLDDDRRVAAPRSRPFFAYLAFQAIHIPVQAPPHFTDNYDGVYDEGWHALRIDRWHRAQGLGLVPRGAPLASMPAGLRVWDRLAPADRRLLAARMQVNAGMLEAMDHHVGRLISYLEERGDLDNTVFVVTSDNGPEPSRADDDARMRLWLMLNGYRLDADRIGERGSYGFIGPEWASAAASPSALFKFYASEGGVRVPLVVAGPGVASGRIDARAFVTDIAPTLLELAGVGAEADAGVPITGRSLLPVLQNGDESIYRGDDAIGIEVAGNAALYRGDYKIVRNLPPFGDGRWRLFNIVLDPGETRDLASERPDLLAEMEVDYAEYARRMGVLEMPPGYDSREQIDANTRDRFMKQYWWVPILFGSMVLLIISLLWRFGIRRFFRRTAL